MFVIELVFLISHGRECKKREGEGDGGLEEEGLRYRPAWQGLVAGEGGRD